MKKWYESKTVWFNVIACIAVIAQAVTGKEVLSTETQGMILTAVNFVLRLITKHEIDWSKGEEQ
jgi:uncharacterized membrane protein